MSKGIAMGYRNGCTLVLKLQGFLDTFLVL